VELFAVKFANWRSCAVKTPTAKHVFTTPVLHLQCSSRAVIKPLRQRLFTEDDKVALKWGEHHTSFCRHCGQQTVRALIRWTPKFCGPPRIAVYQQPIKDVGELRDCTEAVWDTLSRGAIDTAVRQHRSEHRERKCADTTGTVLVPWAGHFQF